MTAVRHFLFSWEPVPFPAPQQHAPLAFESGWLACVDSATHKPAWITLSKPFMPEEPGHYWKPIDAATARLYALTLPTR